MACQHKADVALLLPAAGDSPSEPEWQPGSSEDKDTTHAHDQAHSPPASTAGGRVGGPRRKTTKAERLARKKEENKRSQQRFRDRQKVGTSGTALWSGTRQTSMPAPCRKEGWNRSQQRCKPARWCAVGGVSRGPNQSWMGALKRFRRGGVPSHSLVHRVVAGALLPQFGGDPGLCKKKGHGRSQQCLMVSLEGQGGVLRLPHT